jgi:lauroyl/myristoyl acyltransferase
MASQYDLAWILLRPWAILVDRLPRLRALRMGTDGAKIRSALAIAFPDMNEKQRVRLMRANLRQRAYNVALTLLVTGLGPLAVWFARAIPIVDRELVSALLEDDRPLLLVSFHTGPIYLMLVAIWRGLAGRKVFVMHQDGGFLFREIERLLRRLGAESVPNTPMAVRGLIRHLRGNDRATVLFGCDYAPGTQIVSFMGRRFRAADGLRLMRDASGVDVICVVWERPGLFPRVRFVRPLATAGDSPEQAARVVQRAFDELAPIVAQAPHRWTAWETFVDRLL